MSESGFEFSIIDRDAADANRIRRAVSRICEIDVTEQPRQCVE
jgi:hypothetical protein